MRCEEVRPSLPELAESGPRAVGPAESHVLSCASCRAELDRYREVVVALASLIDVTAEPPEGFAERMVAGVAEESRGGRDLQRFLARMASNDRVQHAAFSVGGAVVGATAIGLLWWRARRRIAGARSAAVGVR